MLSEKEKEIITFGKQNGKTDSDIMSALTKYRTETVTAPKTPDLQSRLSEVGQRSAETISTAIKGEGQYAGQSPLTRGIAATKGAFMAVPEGAVAMAPEPVRAGLKKASDVIGSGFKALTDLIGSNKQLQEWTQKHPEATNKILEASQGVADLGAISGTILGAEGTVSTLGKGAVLSKTALTTGKEVAKKGFDATSNLVGNATTLVKGIAKSPEKTIKGAAGEVLQGKPADIAQGLKALKEIDTTDVQTYGDLGKKLDDSIVTLSEKVDSELLKDTTKTPLSELTTSLKTKGGNTVTTNYVDTALKQLKELYEKTGDVKAAADIDELIGTAQTEGLTKFDINNISRVYNTEFGSKAFNAMGEPLTSVNAQLYETIRKGVKGKAREGMGGKEAQAVDEIISSMYNTKTLVQKNIEAVNKLQQKIAERGLLEKAGYYVSKYADILTGGTIRGLVGGLLPRGAGYKTLNALDLESRLQKNLEIIKRASEATDEAEITKILSELES